MARRKNTRFIDPRYFMDEKQERLDEEQQTRAYGIAGDTPVLWAAYGPDRGSSTVQGLHGLDNIIKILKTLQQKKELGPVKVTVGGSVIKGPDGRNIGIGGVAVMNPEGNLIFKIPASNREPDGGHRPPGTSQQNGGKTVFTMEEARALEAVLNKHLETA